MVRELINTLSFWQLALLYILILTVLTYLAAFISTRLITFPIDKDHRALSNSLISILSAGFSVLLAFIIINTWNYLLKTQDEVAKEADALAAMMRDIHVFPAPVKTKIMNGIYNYTIIARTQEWAMLTQGKESSAAWAALHHLITILQSFEPRTTLERIYYTQAVRNLETVLETRRNRLARLHSIIPDKLNSALIIGSIFLVVILGLIRGETNFLHITPLLFFSIVLGFNLAIALSFDYPYSGDIAVSNHFFYQGMLGTFKDPVTPS
ncbi:Uncharacterised protein [Legionella beliardensis]|uniref:DUF4239 domain-containing protein n=1 Tax=Legionella beliardensis TaxID=91822 RepID=A0A378HZY6_9GAMM|nr:DUF4239 domain-containing protein [Legionella beliardensis]STX28292.1 Uncharacterised protein [Legionella beliardensis]